jgi:hypothetical protein
LFHSRIICKHRDERFRVTRRFGWTSSDARAFCNERVGSIARAIEDDKFMTGAQQITRHRQAHSSKTDETDLHMPSSPITLKMLSFDSFSQREKAHRL